MAGRGRGATLPAWMTANGGIPLAGTSTETSSADPAVTNVNQFASAAVSNSDDRAERQKSQDQDSNREKSKDERRGDRDRRRSRSRERERDRDRRRSSRDRSSRDRDRGRDRSREKRRKSNSRSRSRGRGREDPNERVNTNWRPRRERASNFDVKPPDGVQLPPVGIHTAPGGVPNSFYSFNGNSAAMAVGGMGNVIGVGGEAWMRIDNSQLTRHARRLYVGGIPQKATEPEILSFFNHLMTRALAPHVINSPPCLKAHLNTEKCYAFLEFASIELCSAGMFLDGVRFEHHSGTVILRVRRPVDYKPELVPATGKVPQLDVQYLEALGCTLGAEGSGRVFIGGLPYHLTDEQIMELLQAFGPLKSFHQVRDSATQLSRGYAFCEYKDLQHAEMAIQGLNGMALGDKTLTCKYAQSPGFGPPQSVAPPMRAMADGGMLGMGGVNTMVGGMLNPHLNMAALGAAGAAHILGGGGGGGAMPTRVLRLSNMLSHEDLRDDSELADIREDVRQECVDVGGGPVRRVITPRVVDGYSPQVEGLIFVEFEDPQVASRAAAALQGRKFAEKIVQVTYYDEERFARNNLG